MWWLIKAKLKNRLVDDQISRFRSQPGEVIIDCGANIGAVAARLWKPGLEIHAFEPNPAAFAVISRRFKRFPSVRCINAALYNREGSIELYLDRRAPSDAVGFSQSSSLLASKSNVDASRGVSVRTIDIAQYVRGLTKPVGLLKMDVEGVEYTLLESLLDAGLLQKIRYVLVEAHESKMPEIRADAERVRAKIAQLGLTNVDLTWH